MRTTAVDPQYLAFLPYYSRHGQDRFLNEQFFHDRRQGCFVDLGAYDGIESSNTLFFEETLGWHGICVEPIPDAFAKLEANRRCLCLNTCAVGSTDGRKKADFLHVRPAVRPPSRDPGRTSNFEKLSGLVGHLAHPQRDLIERILAEHGGEQEVFPVQCMGVNNILGYLPAGPIDLLSLDTEGSELDILAGIDFGRFDISFVCVEVGQAAAEIARFLHGVPFIKVAEVGYDWIYQKPR